MDRGMLKGGVREMKAMILVLSPRESRDLLNGDLSVLVRKKFPKDYVGWVYIYCTKTQGLGQSIGTGKWLTLKETTNWNGKVVARFWCDKVEEIRLDSKINSYDLFPSGWNEPYIWENARLTKTMLHDYLQGKNGKAIYVANPKPFDEPKEIKDFYHHFTLKRCERRFSNTNIEIDDKTGGLRQPTKHGYEYVYPLTSAPRSGWCYVEAR